MTRTIAIAIALLLTACTSLPEEPQLGEPVRLHHSYIEHCQNYPDSVFCDAER